MLPSPRTLLSAFLAAAALGTLGRAQEPIKVGEVASLTGKDAAFGQSSHAGTLLAIEEINAGGGLLGRPVELVVEDDACRPGDAATAARQLISRDKVVALLGEVASGRSMEMAPIAQEEKIPMITPSSTNPKVTTVGDYIFRVCFIDPFQGAVMAKFARNSLKLQRVAVLDSVSNAYSVGLSKFFKADFAADGGTVALEQKYAEGDKDFRAQLTVIKAAGVDGIFVPGYYEEDALICVQARELGLTLPIFGGDGWEGEPLIAIGGAAVEGIYFSDHFSPEDRSPRTQEFVRQFRARFGGETPDGVAALGYDSAMVLAAAIRRAGTVAADPVRAALAATVNFPGVTGTTTIDAQRNAAKTATIITVRGGQFHFVETIAP